MAQKILIVDDDPVIRMLVSEYLAYHGHNVEVLEDGRLCLERVKASAPDILILDMLMPEITGSEVLQNLRSDPATAGLPVIMLSADKRMAEDSDSVRADCYLQKPFDIKDFLAAIDELK
jgi:CheY-like chemotaxis protein